MNGVFLWIAGLFVALLGSLFAVPSFVDWNSYRGVFEEEASRILGREVRVGGDVNLRLLPAPYVSFGKVRIADSTPGGGEAFFRAESFTMWLSVPPLLQGIVEAKQVELNKPMLRLQVGSDGATSWRDFRLSKGALPFVPRDVSLQSLKISDGVLAVHGPGGEQLARYEIADGELGAPALEGPFRFRGDVKWDDEVRDVRGSTAAVESDGSVRFKLSVRAPRSGNAYTVEGALAELASRPRLTGQLSAVFPRPAEPAPGPTKGAATADGHVFELRSPIEANALGVKLTDIAFTFEQEGQPQLLTGTAEAGWRAKPFVQANLASRWLDLDKIATASPEANPLQTVRSIVYGWAEHFPAKSDVLARITVDQANLAGDLVTGLVVGLEDKGRGLQLQEFRATLPGGGRIDLSGSIARGAGADGFQGHILLRGSNLSRFLAWAGRGTTLAESRGDGTFWLNSQLTVSPGSVELRRAAFDLAGNRLSGDINYRWEGRKQLSVLLEAGQADLSSILPERLGPDLIAAALSSSELKNAADQSLWRALPVLADADLKLRVRANRLTDGTNELRNLDAEVLAQDGTLSVRSLNFVTATGLKLELDGEVKAFATRPKGVVRGLVAAADVRALEDAKRMLGSDILMRYGLEGALPLQLAFTARFGAKSEEALEVTVDGTASGERLSGMLVLEGGLSGWRQAPVDAMVSVEGPAAVRLTRQLLSETSDGGEVMSASSGKVLLKAVGTPSKGVSSLAQLNSDVLKLKIRGQGAVRANGTLEFDGDGEIASSDAAGALGLVGLRDLGATGKAGLRGSARVATTDQGVRISPQALEIGKSKVSGDITIEGPAKGRRINAKLKVDNVALPAVAGLILTSKGKDLASTDANLTEVTTDWRERAFDFSNLGRLGGHIAITADRIAFEDGAGISNAAMEINVEPERVTISKLEGRVMGGTLSSAFRLEKAPGGAAFSGVVGFWDIGLDKLGAGDKSGASGKAQLNLQVAAQGVSPQGILATLSGKGELELKSGKLENLSPDVVANVADAVLSGRAEAGGEALKKALKTELAAGALVLGNRKLPIEVSDGVAKARTVTLDMPDVRLTNDTAVDIATLKMDSEWRVEPKASKSRPAVGKSPLPGISVLYVGPLGSLGSLEPRINSDALERELTVRRMERDVEQLERLRREDEARARAAEADRAKALEAARREDPQVIEAPFPFPAKPALDGTAPPRVTGEQAVPGAPPKVNLEPLPFPAPAPPSSAGGGPSSPLPRAGPVQPSWRDQIGRGDRS